MYQGRKEFSQNDEDGALEAVFDYVGTTDKVYVEFGVESCVECNSRYLREKKGWNVQESLLMDGGNENPDIRLEKVIFWPDNILRLFERFKVKKTFDLLSVDTDSYDFFMLEAILEGGYKPRVIIVEYNANFEITEAKSILPPEEGQDWQRWDATTYQVGQLEQLLPVVVVDIVHNVVHNFVHNVVHDVLHDFVPDVAGHVPAGHPVPVQQVLLLPGLL